jgi:hypothetical protein
MLAAGWRSGKISTVYNNFTGMPLDGVAKLHLMNKIQYQGKRDHVVVQVIKSFIDKLRQNPEIYPIRYYKKNRKFRSNFSAHGVK